VITYAVIIRDSAIVLDEATSRACGHLLGIDGEPNTDGVEATMIRAEIRADAQLIADTTGRAVEIRAIHPSCAPWVVELVEPKS
jgi:hypothetical protein